MIAKSYKKGDVEIIMTKLQDKPVYGVVRIVKNVQPKKVSTITPWGHSIEFKQDIVIDDPGTTTISNRTYEDANEVYDYLLDMELGADK